MDDSVQQLKRLKDVVRPSQEDTQRVLQRSHKVWSSYMDGVESEPRLPPECVQLRRMLCRIPSFPTSDIPSLEKNSSLKLEHRGLRRNVSELFISGISTWETSSGQCDLNPKTTRHQLLFGTQQIATCSFAGDARFINWPGIQSSLDQRVEGNYLAVLTLAWAYILSARWTEMQNPDNLESNQRATHEFLHAQAKVVWDTEDIAPHYMDVDIGDVQNAAARWWAAVLAPGRGWSASLTLNGTTYQSPWSYTFERAHNFRLRRRPSTTALLPLDNIPPTSTSAMDFLAHFCDIHNICGQCSAGLAAALLFPSLRGSTIKLPQPIFFKIITNHSLLRSSIASPDDTIVVTSTNVVFQEMKQLSYYMTLSCNAFGIMALLGGTFFDPEIFCNQVSAWLQPAFEVIDRITQRNDYGMLLAVMSKREPRLGGLWLGAVITGQEKRFLQLARSGTAPVDIHASTWIGTIHSFIALDCLQLPSIDSAGITRADECRLLFITNSDDYPRPPICPWKPFGTTILSDTEIEVREHSAYAEHYLHYMSWRWEAETGTYPEDRGFVSHYMPPSQTYEQRHVVSAVKITQNADGILMSEEASEVATRSIFSWLRVGGYPICERGIRTHSWFDVGDSDDEELAEGSNSAYEGGDHKTSHALVNDWLNSIDILGCND